MASTPMLVLAMLGTTYAFLSMLLHFTQDSREPPAVETSIPFITSLIGQLRGAQKFFVKLRSVTTSMFIS